MDRSQSYRPDKPPGCRRVKRPPVGFASPHPFSHRSHRIAGHPPR
ncbi:hypothetical protein CSPX01_06285 [Colletotrichum filicis]|nr:hypothetical protein CSPX01_06285 [Colletotrichum filicis]